jgi:hypothetical protein
MKVGDVEKQIPDSHGAASIGESLQGEAIRPNGAWVHPTVASEPSEDVKSLRAAASAAEALVRQLRDTLHRVEESRAETQKVTAVTRDDFSSLMRRIQNAASAELTPDELSAMSELLKGLIQKPNDILVIVKISEMAASFASVVDAYAQVRRLIDGLPR